MAALTTALGMIPLLFDAFFIATVLTMVVIPVIYAVLFKIPALAKN